jgi:thiol:disulfide interchange protein
MAWSAGSTQIAIGAVQLLENVTRPRFITCATVGAIVAAALPQLARAQSDHPIHWEARAAARSVKPSDTTRVLLHATIDEFFHLYSTTQGPGGPVPTSIALLDSQSWKLAGKPRAPAPQLIPDRNFGTVTEIYDDSVTIAVRLVAPGSLQANAAPPRLGVRYQTCTDRYCLPPRTDTLVVALVVEGGTTLSGTPSLAAVPLPSSEPPRPTSAETHVVRPAAASAEDIAAFGGSSGVGAFLILAATMGALALLTPCVFPMIPITVTSFLSVTDERRRGVARAALYALGIVASFTGLGVLTAALFGASGLARFSASPIVNLAIAALFVAFALSLLGVTRIGLPSTFMTRLASVRLGSDSAGTILMGVIFTLTAFTCTAPFIGTLLVMSSQGNWRWPLGGMIVFSAVFAAPFFVIALVPGLLRRQPAAGDWMPALETIVGAIELAAAIKFVSNADLVLGWGLLTRRVVLALWIAILAALIVVLLRRPRVGGTAPTVSRFRIAGASGALLLGALLVPGLSGRRLGELDAFLPPMSAGAVTIAVGSELPWLLNDYRAALAAAARDERPVLIDFTGYTCTNCRWMEANMFPRGEVKHALDRFVRVRLYTDGLGEPYATQQRLEQELFGTVALPLYAALSPDGRPRATFLGMTRNAAEFTAFLERGAQAR